MDVPWPDLTESSTELRARAVRVRTLARELTFGAWQSTSATLPTSLKSEHEC